MSDILPVCFLVDANIYKHLIHVCKSIMKHIQIDYHFCILTDKETTVNEIRIFFLEFCPQDKFTVKYILQSDAIKVQHLYYPESRVDINSLNLAQCFLHRYFDNFKKIFFMEPDQIVRKDLTGFWRKIHEEDIKIGISKYPVTGPSITCKSLTEQGYNDCSYTYNTGVMVIDTLFWKENNCEELCMTAYYKQKHTNGYYFNHYAEGAINTSLWRMITQIDSIYNTCNLGGVPRY